MNSQIKLAKFVAFDGHGWEASFTRSEAKPKSHLIWPGAINLFFCNEIDYVVAASNI